jgi:hypothetical protein
MSLPFQDLSVGRKTEGDRSKKRPEEGLFCLPSQAPPRVLLVDECL